MRVDPRIKASRGGQSGTATSSDTYSRSMNRGVAALASTILAAGLAVVPFAPASADEPAPPITKAYAKQMKCRYPEATSVAGGGPNRGVDCRVIVASGRQDFWVLKYKDFARGLDYWRQWTEQYDVQHDPGYIARKGKILIIPTGGGSGEDDDNYSLKWATYAAKKLGGSVVPGYPA